MAQISSHLTIVMEPYIIFLSNLKRATKYATQIFMCRNFPIWPAFLCTFDLWVAIKKMNCGIFDKKGGKRGQT